MAAPGATENRDASRLGSPSLVLVGEGKVTGPLVHDARIAALRLAHGVTELCTFVSLGRYNDLN